MSSDNGIQKILLIIEPNLGGHRIFFVRWIAIAAKEAGYHPILLTSEKDLDDNNYRSILYDDYVFDKGAVISIPYKKKAQSFSIISLMKESMNYRNWLKLSFEKVVAREGKPDAVMIPSLDTAMYAIALIGSPFENVPWSGIVMRPTFHLMDHEQTNIVNHLKEVLVKKLIKNEYLTTLFSNDELLVKYLNNVDENNNKVVFLPDPVRIKNSVNLSRARERLGIPRDTFVILAYGHLTKRKGITLLLESMPNVNLISDVYLILAGRQHDSIKDDMNSMAALNMRKNGRLLEVNRILDDTDEEYVFAASDVVWLAYEDHLQMSGVMVQAGVWRKPIIASQPGVMGKLTKDHQLGVVLSENSVEDVVKAILTLRSDEGLRIKLGGNGKKYFLRHDINNVKQIFKENLLNKDKCVKK